VAENPHHTKLLQNMQNPLFKPYQPLYILALYHNEGKLVTQIKDEMMYNIDCLIHNTAGTNTSNKPNLKCMVAIKWLPLNIKVQDKDGRNRLLCIKY